MGEESRRARERTWENKGEESRRAREKSWIQDRESGREERMESFECNCTVRPLVSHEVYPLTDIIWQAVAK